jgi:hypothetical protein
MVNWKREKRMKVRVKGECVHEREKVKERKKWNVRENGGWGGVQWFNLLFFFFYNFSGTWHYILPPLRKIRPRIYTTNLDLRISLGTWHTWLIWIGGLLLPQTIRTTKSLLKQYPLIINISLSYLLYRSNDQRKKNSHLAAHLHD